MEALIEVFSEAIHEIAAKPMTFVIEVVQFGVLVLIIKMVAWGGKKRSGMLKNMLAEHRAKIEVRLEEAARGEAWLAQAHTQVEEIAAAAASDVARTLREARRQAREQRAAIEADGKQQAAAILAGADEALAREQVEMLEGIREQLIEVVTQSTQQVLEQGFSPAEQRAVIQKAIVSGIQDLESVALA